MKYSIRKVPAGTTSVHEEDVWEVLKTPTQGDPVLIATYHHPSLARWLLGCFHGSIEVRRLGSTVEYPPVEPEEVVVPAADTPDELVW